MPTYNLPVVLGIMSGSSLDGLDLAICRFRNQSGKWDFELLKNKTVPYTDYWRNRLENASKLNGLDLIILDSEYGIYIGKLAEAFIYEANFNVKLISSHGHTIFHQPEKGITFQAGSGANIAAITGITTITDFRRTDVALGGQGAPFVPVGDELLFSDYDYCLNLGGFANISYRYGNQRIAFDICPANIILNLLAQRSGVSFDKDGLAGRRGRINKSLLEKLNNLIFYKKHPPKSLGREWLLSEFLPVLDDPEVSLNDKIRTVYEHISMIISNVPENNKKLLFTGGGTHNKFLLELIMQKSKARCILPDKDLINFKEAIIFAFLGLLRFQGEVNCLASVTGAERDSCCGTVYKGLSD